MNTREKKSEICARGKEGKTASSPEKPRRWRVGGVGNTETSAKRKIVPVRRKREQQSSGKKKRDQGK